MKLISKKQKTLFIISIILCVISGIIIKFAEFNTELISKYYSLGFYKHYITFLSKLNGLVPFSIAEILIILFVVLSIIYIVLLIKTIISNRKRLFSVFLMAFLPASIIFFLFTISFTPNYYRHTFSEYSGLEICDTTVDNLYSLCEKLALDANMYRKEIEQPNQVFTYENDYTNDEIFKLCTKSYAELINDYPEYENLFDILQNAKAKPVLCSEAMQYLMITGFFFGLTGEANININHTKMFIPSTVNHELAHVSGFMREDEANFISYLACRSSSNEMLNYSGTMLALIHSINALYKQDADRYFEIIELLSDDVILDIDANNEQYDRYDTKVGDISDAVNDTYLKANNQQNGTKSYGRMVDLLIADFNQNK